MNGSKTDDVRVRIQGGLLGTKDPTLLRAFLYGYSTASNALGEVLSTLKVDPAGRFGPIELIIANAASEIEAYDDLLAALSRGPLQAAGEPRGASFADELPRLRRSRGSMVSGASTARAFHAFVIGLWEGVRDTGADPAADQAELVAFEGWLQTTFGLSGSWDVICDAMASQNTGAEMVCLLYETYQGQSSSRAEPEHSVALIPALRQLFARSEDLGDVHRLRQWVLGLLAAGSAAQTTEDQRTLDGYQRWLQQAYGAQGRWDLICVAASGDATGLKVFWQTFEAYLASGTVPNVPPPS